jgi:translation initiation factor 5
MDLIPIIPNVQDMYYRYKMPRLETCTRGRGNGIKTIITNLDLIAKSIRRSVDCIMKFYGYKISAQVSLDEFTINGDHSTERLLELLYLFIKKYVACYKCNNPETVLQSDGVMLHQNCIACGHNRVIPSDNLTMYIVKNMPTSYVPNLKAAQHNTSDIMFQLIVKNKSNMTDETVQKLILKKSEKYNMRDKLPIMLV